MSADLDTLFSLVKRDHGGCDQNSCTLGVAIRHGYALVAINSWIGCGASDDEFEREAEKGLPFSFDEVTAEAKAMAADIPHVDCPHGGCVLWEPKWCDYWCDNCGKQVPRPAESA